MTRRNMDKCATVGQMLYRTVKFLELFRNYECLLRINSPQYSDRNRA